MGAFSSKTMGVRLHGILEPKSSRTQELNGISFAIQENKKSRIVTDAEGNTRRPANIMMRDDVKMALDVLAAHRRVRVWTLIDQALKEFLERETPGTI